MTSHQQSHIFLVFADLLMLSDTLFDTMVAFAAFDITGSYKVLSIIPSISSIAYIAFGLFAGFIDALSKHLFILAHVIIFIPVTLAMFVALKRHILGIGVFVAFVVLNEISSAFAKPAPIFVYYGMFSSDQAARKLSNLRRAHAPGQLRRWWRSISLQGRRRICSFSMPRRLPWPLPPICPVAYLAAPRQAKDSQARDRQAKDRQARNTQSGCKSSGTEPPASCS